MLISDYLIEIFDKYQIKYKIIDQDTYPSNFNQIEFISVLVKKEDFLYFRYTLRGRELSNYYSASDYSTFSSYNPKKFRKRSEDIYNDVDFVDKDLNDKNLDLLQDQSIICKKANLCIKKIPTSVLCSFYIKNNRMHTEIAIGHNFGIENEVSFYIKSIFDDEKLYWMCHDFVYENENNLQFLDYIQDNYPETDIGRILL